MSQGKRQKGEKTSPDLYVFLKGFWHTKCRFTRVVIKLFQARNLCSPFYTANLRHQGLWQMGSGKSCWRGASKESRWDPVPSPYQPMDGNAGWCLGHPPHRLVSGVSSPSSALWGQEVGEDAPFCRPVSPAGQPHQGDGMDGRGGNDLPSQQDSPETIDTLRETKPLVCLGLDQI